MSTFELVAVCFVGCIMACSALFLAVIVVGMLIRERREQRRGGAVEFSPVPRLTPDETRLIEVVPYGTRIRYRHDASFDRGATVESPRAVSPAAGMTKTPREGHRVRRV